jgi:GWxTD domain-containing protein
LLLLAGSVRADEDVRQPPFMGEGDLSFPVDFCAFRTQEPRWVDLAIYLSISNDQIKFDPTGGGLDGELGLEIILRTEDGKEDAAVIRTELRPQAATELDASDRTIQQVIRERARVLPGRYEILVELVDRRSEKVGLFNRMRNIKNSGSVRTRIEVPDLESEDLALSELAFVRRADAADAEDPFARNGVDFDPNPSRHYGLALSRVKFYVEVYGGPRHEEGDSYLLLSEVKAGSGVPIVERRSRVVPVDRSFVLTDELDLTKNVPAGHYDLVFTVLNERTRQVASTRRPFDVLWSVNSWALDPDGLLQEMALVMTDSEFDTLEELSPGAREIYLSEFWHKLDPTPDTPDNEILEGFRQRVAFADRKFQSTLRRGILTDQGRVYVRYGPPDDVDYQYSSSGFGPGNGTERVSDPAERATISSRPSASFLETDEFLEGDVSGLGSQRGSATVKSKALEVWTYDGRGRSLRPDRQDLSQSGHRGLKFVFADEMGNGDYRLIGSEGATVY